MMNNGLRLTPRHTTGGTLSPMGEGVRRINPLPKGRGWRGRVATRRVRQSLFFLLLFSSAQATPPPLPSFPKLEFHPPKPERYVLPNGLTVFLLEDHEL